jgi:hypothetical protein
MRARKVSSMISSVSQENTKMYNVKSKEQSTQDSVWEKKKSSRNTGISKYLSIITLNANGLTLQSKDTDCLIRSKSKMQQSVV